MKKDWSNEETSVVLNHLKNGKNYKEIAVELNRSRDSVRYIANHIGETYKSNQTKIDCDINEKYCGTCKSIKLKKEFNKNKSKSDGYNTICKNCSSISSKEYYKNNKNKHKEETLKRSRNTRKENRKLYFNILKKSFCIDCGEDNHVVLEHDHKDGVEKYKNISELVGNGTSWKTIEKEMDKCEIRCANCHRIRTAKQQGWYKDLL